MVREPPPAGLGGTWWIAGQESNRIPGWLRTAEGDEAALELSGVLRFPPSVLGGAAKGTLVVGQDDRGRYIALLDAYAVSTRPQVATGGTRRGSQTVRAYTVLMGLPELVEQEPTFEAITFSLDGLAEWVAPYFDLLGFADSESEHDDDEQTVVIKAPRELPFKGGDGSLTLWSGVGPTIGDVEYRFSAEAAWTFTTRNPKTFDDLWDEIVQPLRNLQTLFTGEPTYPHSIRARVHSRSRRRPFEGWLDVYTYVRRPLRSFRRQSWLWPVTLPQVAERLPSIAASWLEISRPMRPALSSLFALLSNEMELYLENRFLMAVQAAEAYHRHHPGFTKRVLTEAEHTELLEALLAVVERARRDWLRKRLQYAYEPTLRQRLRELARHVDAFGQRIVPQPVIGEIVDARNNVVHSLTAETRSDDEHAAMALLERRLTLLLRASLLRDVGLDAEEIEDGLLRNPAFAFLAQRHKPQNDP